MFRDFLTITFSALVTLAAICIAFFKWRYQYWHRKGLPYLQPRIPFGNQLNPLNRKVTVGVTVKHFYEQMKAQGWKHGGTFSLLSPSYNVIDLEYVKNVMSRDFQHFVDRGFYYNEKADPLSAHLFAIGGAKWRSLRTKLTPTFTSGKMKMMFQTLLDCVPSLEERLEIERRKNAPIDIKEALACFTTNVIGSCAFGLECMTFKDEDSPFRKYGKKVLDTPKLLLLKTLLAFNFPLIATMLGVKVIGRDVSEFFTKIVKDTVEHREKNELTRKDFLQLLLDMKSGNDTGITMDEITAQSFVFFIAGYETSSTLMSFALYELARRQDLQAKLREEIVDVLEKFDGKITYEALQNMKYMDQIIDETLRKYPPVPFLTRKCVKDYQIPDDNITIEKGTWVLISILGIHNDPEYYPDPDKFDPERFSEDNKKLRHAYAHIPFGEGPRLCIGMRFGIMQAKVGLTSLLKNYNFTVNLKTQEPLRMKATSFVLAAEGEIWLNAERIK